MNKIRFTRVKEFRIESNTIIIVFKTTGSAINAIFTITKILPNIGIFYHENTVIFHLNGSFNTEYNEYGLFITIL